MLRKGEKSIESLYSIECSARTPMLTDATHVISPHSEVY